MAMSADTSPQHATHLTSSYQTSTPVSHPHPHSHSHSHSHSISHSSNPPSATSTQFPTSSVPIGNGLSHDHGMGAGNGTLHGEEDVSMDSIPPAAALSISTSVGSASSGASNNVTTPLKGKNGATGPADGKAKPHICQICQRAFTTGGHLQRHQRIHTGVKAFKCPFPGCETRTSRQDNLQQHYRTHLSPSLRRGSGSGARAAVNAAMEAAGLKSTSARAPRKSKGSAAGTPSSTTSASASHLPSPYTTPNSAGPTAYGQPYMYDPGHYPAYPTMSHPMTQPQSATSSRVPSPVNGHSAHGGMPPMPPAHHQQPYFNQFPPYYPGMHHQPAYRYGQSLPPSPYTAGPHGHHSMYTGMVPDHNHQYSPMQTGFPNHSRESSYGMMTPSQYGPGSLSNGYPPPRTQTSTPIRAIPHDADERYRRGQAPGSPRRRASAGTAGHPHAHDMISQGVLDPSHMSTTGRQPQSATAAYGPYSAHPSHHAHAHTQAQAQIHPQPQMHPQHMSHYSGYNSAPGVGSLSAGNSSHAVGASTTNTASANTTPGGQTMAHRASISSLSDGGSANGAPLSDSQKGVFGKRL